MERLDVKTAHIKCKCLNKKDNYEFRVIIGLMTFVAIGICGVKFVSVGSHEYMKMSNWLDDGGSKHL
jgi:hypothetical protein